MYCVKYGSGKDIFVGLHGWSGDHRTFDALIPYLPKEVTFYSADLPGVGKSPAPRGGSLSQIVLSIVDWITSLQSSSITILGNCSGGLIGLFVAKHLVETGREAMLNRLYLIDPFAYFPWYFKVFVAPEMGRIGWYAYCSTFANPFGRWLTNMSLYKRRTLDADLTSSFSKVNHRMTYKYLQLLAEGGPAEQFNVITAPVTILYGEKTFSAVQDSISLWQKILPKVYSYKLNEAGHLPIVEATSQLAAILFRNTQSSNAIL